MKRIIAVLFILVLLLSCSGCKLITNSKPYKKIAYEKATVAYDEAITLIEEEQYHSAVDSFKIAVEQYKMADDYQDAPEKAQLSMDCYDKTALINLKRGLGSTKTLSDANEVIATLYNLESAEKYNQLYYISRTVYQLTSNAESYISSNLKNPSSYKTINSYLTWDVSHMKENTYSLSNISILVDYTATNAFGGTVRNKETITFNDSEYVAKFKYTELDTETVLSIFNYRDWLLFFEDLINSYDVLN